jgi:hypothetical protein
MVLNSSHKYDSVRVKRPLTSNFACLAWDKCRDKLAPAATILLLFTPWEPEELVEWSHAVGTCANGQKQVRKMNVRQLADDGLMDMRPACMHRSQCICGHTPVPLSPHGTPKRWWRCQPCQNLQGWVGTGVKDGVRLCEGLGSLCALQLLHLLPHSGASSLRRTKKTGGMVRLLATCRRGRRQVKGWACGFLESADSLCALQLLPCVQVATGMHAVWLEGWRGQLVRECVCERDYTCGAP